MLTPSDPADLQLSPCQSEAIHELYGQSNVFLTGGAGTGKSFLIKEFLKTRDPKKFPVLASTGAAAVLVGGRTFHSFIGLGIMEGGVQQTIHRAMTNKRVVRRLQKIDGFILDEVSMISGPTFHAAERICRLARASEQPWGGLRVIAVGDFAQLPPVQRFNSGRREWAFTEPSWSFSGFKMIQLKTVMRTQDPTFLDVLGRVRQGIIDDSVTDYLNERCMADDEEFVGPRLFPRKDAVSQFNHQKLAELDTEARSYETEYGGQPAKIEQLKKMAPIEEVIHLKRDCLVMLRQNDLKQRWVNGSLGHIREMENDFLLVELMNGRLVEIDRSSFSMLDAEGEVVAVAQNFPVSLAYATTIHKAQGATFDSLRADLTRLWEPGQAYVALSRVTHGEALRLDGWNPNSIKVDPNVTRFYRNSVH